MSTVAAFKTPDDLLYYFFNDLFQPPGPFIFFATYLVQVPLQESSFDKYVCYFSAILVKYMQWNELTAALAY